ncbi:MAG: Holliday junction resolvase RuvX [Actinomycetaceae bacterium]|nr:Holliday junction resolvase RuvX [Arcanobacterium sp.]MDD7686426.1 Holliday junction resolvase RuvX [Actinomycetaceae bacterium]MDY5272706.1 Holliday junction resolvase RuvX [Arcanobacterium sp.]
MRLHTAEDEMDEEARADSVRRVRAGVRIAVDLGRVRVGIAKSDAHGIMAVPVMTAQRGKNDMSALMRLVRTESPLEIYVGYPLNMDGSAGPAARAARAWALRLAKRVAPLPVRMIDERLTSVIAHRQLHEAGRKEINHRAVVDQVAAINILESALEQERVSGGEPGIAVTALSASCEADQRAESEHD